MTAEQMTAEQIDTILRSNARRHDRDPGGGVTPTEEALRSLARLSVSVLRMIDARREQGIPFDRSYNEEELRRALASMADQTFPPGPPMRLADRDELVEALRIIDDLSDGLRAQDSGHVIPLDQIAALRALLDSTALRVFPASSVNDEAHDFQRLEHVTLNRTGGWTSRELKIVCRCGWAGTSIDRDPDEKIAVAAARELLQAHVTEAIDRASKHKESVR